MIKAQFKSLPDFAAELRKIIQSDVPVSPAEFNQLALELFGLQFAVNSAYQNFCRSRKITPNTIREWHEIPAILALAFKELELTSLPIEQRTRVFHSSGTTAQTPSRHFHSEESLSVYEASLLPWFKKHLLPDSEKIEFLFLTPKPSSVPHSSLVHMFESIADDLKISVDAFVGGVETDGAWNLDLKKVVSLFKRAETARKPLMLLGTAFNFVHLLDHLISNHLRFELPTGSRVMETGGYKGRSRTMPKTELHDLITQRLGVPAGCIVCEYGMSELSSQAYDGRAGETAPRTFHFPPWARARVVSPEAGREVAYGETGLIRIFDLANVYSVMALQTEDLGIRRGDGFELAGRAVQAEPRGCSLQIV